MGVSGKIDSAMKYVKIIVDHYRSRGSVWLFFCWILLRLLKKIRIGFGCEGCDRSKAIDVVIPTISKDFEVLGLVVQSLKFLGHNINKIFIVAPKSNVIEQFCAANDLVFIDEASVLGFGKSYIHYTVEGNDRSGWLFQQLLKLSGDSFVEMDDYLVVDSDTVFVNENCFLRSGKYVFYANEEWHQAYFDAFKFLFGYRAPTKWSLTSHMMIFNRNLLGEMKREIELGSGLKWYDAYIATSSVMDQSCVSDYETYANWVIFNYPEMALVKPLYNRNVFRENIAELDVLCGLYRSCRSISFHSYLAR